MKAVTPHTFRIKTLRNSVAVRDGTMAAMERGVETGDLRQAGKALQQDADRREIVRLM